MAHLVLMVSSMFLLLLFAHQSSGEEDDQAMTFLGCFDDNRLGIHQLIQISLDECLVYCRDRHFTYFFIKQDEHRDDWCKCSDVLPTKKLVGCSQTQSRSGVGAFRINDWSTFQFEYVACQTDNETGSDFTQKSLFVDKTNLTLEKCMIHCARLNHSYMALQNGEECRCGQTYSQHADRGRCCTTCIGNELQYCGGNSSNSIYKISEPNPIVHSQDCYMISKTYDYSGFFGAYDHLLGRPKCVRLCEDYNYMSIPSGGSACYCHQEDFREPFGTRCSSECATYPSLCDDRIIVNSYGIIGLSYQGCYRQGKPSTNWGVHHLLTDYTINSQTMTLKECGIICAAGRYPFMGLTEGQGCKCMETLTGLGRKSLCQLPCEGDKNQICGDVQKYSVYSLNNFTPPSHVTFNMTG